jgi:hypothetical protein
MRRINGRINISLKSSFVLAFCMCLGDFLSKHFIQHKSVNDAFGSSVVISIYFFFFILIMYFNTDKEE